MRDRFWLVIFITPLKGIMDELRQSLLNERDDNLRKVQEVYTEAREAGAVFTAEQNEKIAKLTAAADEAEARADNRAKELELEARMEQRQEDEARRHFQRAPEVREEAEVATRAASEEFRNWLRGDPSHYGKEINLDVNAASPHRRAASQEAGEVRVLGIGTAGAGGATVPTPFLQMLYDYRETYSTFRSLNPEVLTTAGGEPFELPIVAAHGTAVAPVAENATIAGTDPTFGKITLGAYKAGQVVELSNELIMDTGVPLEQWVARDIGRALARAEDNWFYNGTGTNQPQGIVNGGFGTARVGTAINGSGGSAPPRLEYQDFTAVLGGIDDSYAALGSSTPQMGDSAAPGLTWVMDPSTFVAACNVVDGDGRFLFQPNLSAGLPDTFLGHRVVKAPALPNFARATNVIYFGAFNEAVVVRDAGGVTLAYSDDANFKNDQRVYRATCRVDSKVRDSRAVTLFRTVA